jgi:hypothetical protein
LFNVIDPSGVSIPVEYKDVMTFETNTPDIISINVSAGSAIVDIDGKIVPTFNTDTADEYVKNELVMYDNKLYFANTDTTTTGVPGVSTEYSLIGPSPAGPGAIVNFANGIVDWANPLTWPIIATAVDLPDLSSLATLLDPLVTALNLIGGTGIIDTVLAAIPLPIGSFIPGGLSLNNFIDILNQLANYDTAGLAETNAYIGHANVGLVPSATGNALPVLNLVSGPPYPVILASGGTITNFAAEYDTLLSLNLSLILAGIPGLSLLIDAYSSIQNILTDAINTVGGLLPIPSFPSISLPSATSGSLNVFAKLWHLPASTSGPVATTWTQVAQLDLGTVDLATLAPLDQLPDVAGGLGATLGSLLSFNAADGDVAVSNFRAGTMAVTANNTVSAGDYLMVQFGLANSGGLTVFAGVAAPNAIASVTIR